MQTQRSKMTRKQRRGGSSALFLTGAVALGVLAATAMESGLFKPKESSNTPLRHSSLRHSPPRHTQHKVTQRHTPPRRTQPKVKRRTQGIPI